MKAKMKLKKLWSFLLVLVMAVGLMPTTTARAEGATPATATADFSSDPIAALALLNTYKTAGAADSTWDDSTKTLTLNGVNFETNAATAVKLPKESVTIVLNGENTIISGDSATTDCYGILAPYRLTITGDGKLTVTGGDSINDDSYGIYANSDVEIIDCNVTAKGGEAVNSYGAKSCYFRFEDSDFTSIGGTASNSYGIRLSEELRISDSNVIAKGGPSKNDSIGINSYNVIIYGGSLIAIGNTMALTTRPYTDALNYWWRTSESDSYTNHLKSSYIWNKLQNYVEIRETIPGYTVTFDANGGTGTMATLTGVYDIYTLPANGFTASAGKKFKGWATSADGAVISTTTIDVTANTTLYAIWENIPAIETETADFSANYIAALGLLNAHKTEGAPDSTWDPTTLTLTLNGINFETTAATAIELPDTINSVTIILHGENTIIGGDSATTDCYGIFAPYELTIKGDGKLTVTGGDSTAADTDSCGIHAYDLSIEGGDITAKGGAAKYSYGIDSIITVGIKGGSTTGSSAGVTLIATGEAKAFKNTPTLYITDYQWRTANTGSYTDGSVTPYTYDASHKYVEIREKIPGAPKQTGWIKEDGNWYYYNEKNEAVTGWLELSSKWYYMDANGVMKTGWQQIGGKWYYLGTNGAMKTGWQQISGKWYYLGTNGVMKTGWQQISGKWYYLGTNGAMLTGWQQIGGKWYYLGTNGVMKTGWQQIGGKWYYLGTNGAMKTGWQQISGKWYYLGTNGVMKTGWLQLGSTWYYLKSSGVMACNETLTINGKTYTFSSTGAWIR